MALTTVTVTGKVLHPDKQTPCTGAVVFKPGAGLLISAADNTVLAGTIPVDLATDGTFTIALPATDNTGTQPEPNTWNWSIEFRLRDAVVPPFSFALPSSPTSTDLSRLIRVLPAAGTYLVVPGPAGPKGDKGDPGSGGAVDSVNGQTGTVVLHATDVGADPSGAATTALASAKTYADAGDTNTLNAAKAYTDTHSGGTGTTVATPTDDRIDLEIIVLTNVSTWTVVRTSGGTPIGKSVPASAGDRVWVSPSFMYTGNQYYLDMAVMKGDGTISRFASSSGTSTTPGPEGYAPDYTQAASFPHVSGIAQFVVAADEIDANGNFTVNLAYIAPSLSGTDQKVYCGNGYLGRWLMANIGPA